MRNTPVSNYLEMPDDLPEPQDVDWVLSSFAFYSSLTTHLSQFGGLGKS